MRAAAGLVMGWNRGSTNRTIDVFGTEHRPRGLRGRATEGSSEGEHARL